MDSGSESIARMTNTRRACQKSEILEWLSVRIFIGNICTLIGLKLINGDFLFLLRLVLLIFGDQQEITKK